MSASPAAPPSLQDHLTEPLRLGHPDVHGPLAVFPLFGPAPQLGYVSFAQACAAGASVKELEGGASVNDLIVINPTDQPILLYEGEEVLGAQQNRTFDASPCSSARAAGCRCPSAAWRPGAGTAVATRSRSAPLPKPPTPLCAR